MCRGKQNCSELGVNPQLWSRETPLRPPEWFKSELLIFKEAVFEASIGNRNRSLLILSKIRSDEMRNWFVEHGQMSGLFRTKILQIAKPKLNDVELDILRSPDRYTNEVFERDSYTCRYCGIGIIPKNILAAYSKAIGRDAFRDTGTNSQRHGVVMAFRANADHVVPWSLGGKTDPDNLVTSCWSCNYGKAEYTLEQIGLIDPRTAKLPSTSWNGLLPLLKGLKKYAL